MNEVYKDKDWLRNEYIIKRTPMWKIAESQNIAYGTIHYWMTKHNIKRRNYSECVKGNHITLSNEVLEFITGELLGDGCLSAWKNISARYIHGSQHEKYIEWLSEKLSEFGIEQSGKINKRLSKIKSGEYTGYKYTSKYYRELFNLYQSWYPNGIKHIPRDLEFTPIIARQWYIGDGCLVKPKRSIPWIQLSTDAFNSSDLKLLIDKLKDEGINATRRKSNHRLFLLGENVVKFLNYIGNCPNEIKDIYGYKWLTDEDCENIMNRVELERLADDTYRSKEWLYQRYWIDGLNQREIAKRCGVNRMTINKCMRCCGINARFGNTKFKM